MQEKDKICKMNYKDFLNDVRNRKIKKKRNKFS